MSTTLVVVLVGLVVLAGVWFWLRSQDDPIPEPTPEPTPDPVPTPTPDPAPTPDPVADVPVNQVSKPKAKKAAVKKVSKTKTK